MSTNLSVPQYATFKLDVFLTDTNNIPFDITRWDFSGSIRDCYNGPVVTNFSSSVLSFASASVEFSLLPSQTGLLSCSYYFYDIVAVANERDPVEVYRLLEGRIKVDRGATQVLTP